MCTLFPCRHYCRERRLKSEPQTALNTSSLKVCNLTAFDLFRGKWRQPPFHLAWPFCFCKSDHGAVHTQPRLTSVHPAILQQVRSLGIMTATSLPQPVVRDSVSYGLQLSPGLPPLNSATVCTLLGLQELSAPLQKVLTLWCHAYAHWQDKMVCSPWYRGTWSSMH